MNENQDKASGPDQGAAQAKQPRASVNTPEDSVKLSPQGVHALGHVAAGWKVFQCRPDGKEPLTENGFKDATDDPERVVALWRKNPDANIGGVVERFVLDVDCWKLNRKTGQWERKPGLENLAKLEQEHGKLKTRTHSTPGGGRQYLFSTNGRDLRQTTELAAGIDTRAAGKGYIM